MKITREKELELKLQLKRYGKVVVCKAVNERFEVKITDGFDVRLTNTLELMELINEAIKHKYSVIDILITDDNIFHYIAKPKQ